MARVYSALPTKNFICKYCGIEFTKVTRSFAWYCSVCRKKISSKNTMNNRVKHYPNTKIGVGSGGNQLGDNNPLRKRGKYSSLVGGKNLMALYNKKKIPSLTCEMCDSYISLQIHHKNCNGLDHRANNLIKLCRTCHYKIHKLIKQSQKILPK